MTRPMLQRPPVRLSLPSPHGRIGRSAAGVLVASAVIGVVSLLILQVAAVLVAATVAPIFMR